ncbi:cobalamin biosynthesis protein CbiD [Oscillospiraceae bacterium CM]|nr:cobalamin biosynthesis protein CbiD [Oscillospiraceae bacterium CM]
MSFEHYIQKGAQKLRLGYTTGTCAALAAKAAAEMLLTGLMAETISLTTPKGLDVTVPVLGASFDDKQAACAVRKDAGDDPDVTDGMLVCALVSRVDEPGIMIDGGIGVGRVTKPGLNQPVGAAAINTVPRRMIAEEVAHICQRVQYTGGLTVVISIPEGEDRAKKTFNEKLGIKGGLSVLGTSGIVEPMSTQALIDCIGLELRALAAEGHRSVVLTPGNYGTAFLSRFPKLRAAPTVKFSNFIGEALRFAVQSGFQKILVVGHLGKLVKLAGGIMNTHSGEADCRAEILAAHAALCGAGQLTVRAIMDSAATDACVDILMQAGIRDEVLKSLLSKIEEQLQRKTGEATEIGAVLFSNTYGFLGQTASAASLIESFGWEENK